MCMCIISLTVSHDSFRILIVLFYCYPYSMTFFIVQCETNGNILIWRVNLQLIENALQMIREERLHYS